MMKPVTLHHQHGAVLIISLIILLVLTVIGVTGMSNTTLEERMSQNFEHQNMVFQGAESAIENVMTASNPDSEVNPFYTLADDPIDQLYSLGAGGSLTVNYTPGDYLNNANVTTASTLTFDGSNLPLCPGGSKNSVCRIVQVNAQAQITNTNTSTQHIQGVYRLLSNTGSGNDFYTPATASITP